MRPAFDLYWSFRSPYSYLVTDRVFALERQYDVQVNVRIVMPLAVRDPDFFKRADPLLTRYVALDAPRVAEFIGVPFRWPRPDPVTIDPVTLEFAAHQPYIGRLSRLGVEAVRQGRGLPFIRETSRLIWGGQVRDWHQGDHLASASRAAGLTLQALEAAIAAPDADHDSEIQRNQIALREVGHWGVPTMVLGGEPFFGQDRFSMLVDRLKRAGMRERASPTV
ncbi:DsbA family protein [Ramlibacter sp. AW1]|uniref:2-hydroxychromene-2-carboxylate isomerase n=1 Tax=Ramlibacter aurantiacus TaxID=2801330 RepID=A0A936ZMT4_9BURK|nr:DsbA family protein [Ramlibacter aurantiacus]MBL0423058.1 DsbA family protein [Ramlibacter aurantiacus]